MNKARDTEVKVGIFVSIGLALTMFGIFILGSSTNFLQRNNTYVVRFPAVDGLIEGAKVVVSGLNVGVIGGVQLESHEITDASKRVRVTLKIAKKYEAFVRGDSTAEILTQGVLGDKYISVKPGSPDAPALANGEEIPAAATKDLSQFISKGDQLMGSLNSIASSLDRMLKGFEQGGKAASFFDGMAATAKNLSQASAKLNTQMDNIPIKKSMENLNAILAKINNGTGTLGALVNDPGLYYDAKALLGGANRNRIIRNLVRQTVRKAEEAEAPEKK